MFRERVERLPNGNRCRRVEVQNSLKESVPTVNGAVLRMQDGARPREGNSSPRDFLTAWRIHSYTTVLISALP
jgi:hypothetical protein